MSYGFFLLARIAGGVLSAAVMPNGYGLYRWYHHQRSSVALAWVLMGASMGLGMVMGTGFRWYIRQGISFTFPFFFCGRAGHG